MEIYPGFAGADLIFDQTGVLKGVVTPDQGLDREGRPTESFERGMELHGRFTLIAEGARGSLAQQLIRHFELDKDCAPAKYALGLKELWQVPGAICIGQGWFVTWWGGRFRKAVSAAVDFSITMAIILSRWGLIRARRL